MRNYFCIAQHRVCAQLGGVVLGIASMIAPVMGDYAYAEFRPPVSTTGQDVGSKCYDNGCTETAKNLLIAEAALVTLYVAIPLLEAATIAKAFTSYGVRVGAAELMGFCTTNPDACKDLLDAMKEMKEQLEQIKDAKKSYDNCVKLIQESVMRCAGINPEIIDGGLRPAIGTMCMMPAAGSSYCGTCCNKSASLGEKQCDKATTDAEKLWCKNNTIGCMGMCTAMQKMEDAANKIKDAEFKRRMIEEARMREYMKDSMRRNYTTPYTTPTVDPTLRTRRPGM